MNRISPFLFLNRKVFSTILILIITISGCQKEERPIPLKSQVAKPPTSPGRMLILRVDYMKRVFEGATEIELAPSSYSGDFLPIIEIFKSPSDLGNLQLIYKPSQDTLFDGSIIWMGCGRIRYPARFDSAYKFPVASPLPDPPMSRFQMLHSAFVNFGDTIPWNAIHNLEIVQNYFYQSKKIGCFLYTPSVGMGDPYDWDWFFLLSN
jgi:hypothetical protein